jgi:hypothetical protein
MFKKAGQRGRSERAGEAYSVPYGEPPSDARTKLEAFFNILIVGLARFFPPVEGYFIVGFHRRSRC